ncbi:MAG: ABC transporter substrate-binding protein [Rhodospirillales bacterium]|nr:ABC transporter substrate-binding protein [Rhodospirillales bacterium]MDE2199640.1 ABC transporter substrate-binding protein [Rhodospirillales bacterium]MDE2574487.1 ABC transporter substrate-binding protein [Rhodospirillales bacterium]
MIRAFARLLALLSAVMVSLPAMAASCPVKIGSVMPLTGPLAPVVAGMLKSAQLAVNQLNAAGGVLGCKLDLVVRDSQAQPSLAVDAAHQLIDLEGVRVIVGEVTSGGTAAVLNSVTVPAHVPLISPTASAPSFSDIGRSTGLFFRTNASDALQGVAAASQAIAGKSGTVAVLAVNNDWGQNLSRVFKEAYEKLGGHITRIVLYNPGQSSYRAEISAAMQGAPHTLYLIGYATEGAQLARDWISQGGTQNFLFAHNMNDAAFVKAVGAKYLQHAVWLTPGSVQTPSLDNFRAAYTAMTKQPAEGPGRASTYDAVVLAALAIEAAKSATDGPAIAAGFRRVTDAAGVRIDAGEAGFKTALAALAKGQSVNYIGATGPLQFDASGDIAVPFVAWTLDAQGALHVSGHMSVEDVQTLRTRLFAK